MNEESNMVAAPMFKDQCEVIQSSFTETFNTYDILLDESIREPAYYRQAFHVLRTARQGDRINLILNNGGGRLDTAIVFRNLINETEADVIAILEGDTHSASSMIALSAHGVEVKPYASMMIHHASFGTYNTVQNVMDHVNFTSSQTERLIRDVYQDFLTPQELDEVVRNREIWLTDEEIGERLDVMFEMRSLRQQESLGENRQLEEHKSLDQMIEEAVSSFYKKLKKDFEITPKVKVKATKAKQAAPATA